MTTAHIPAQMHLDTATYAAPSELAARELLFVGFGDGFDTYIDNYPYDNGLYGYSMVNNPFKAFLWLEQRVESVADYNPPYAIVCDLQWLFDDDFNFIRQVQGHPHLRQLPVVALAEPDLPVDSAFLLSKGIDDCYCRPVDWQVLETRLDFLHTFKPRLLEQRGRGIPEKPSFQIRPLKRLFDIAVALAGIVVTMPVWLLTALAIRLESEGPVIYTSKRVGAGYHAFNFWKFRSMYRDADRRLDDLSHMNQYPDALFVKLHRDPRVTRVGRFIRRYSIDELPQLINVLAGDMSIVGNRPLPLYEAERLTHDEWCARFLAPAGLTGLWQISKRGKKDMSAEERIALDLAYARDNSLATDLKIILKTMQGAFIQKEDV